MIVGYDNLSVKGITEGIKHFKDTLLIQRGKLLPQMILNPI